MARCNNARVTLAYYDCVAARISGGLLLLLLLLLQSMATTRRRKVLLAVDSSPQAEQAFDCKY